MRAVSASSLPAQRWPSISEMAVSESVPSRHAWQCDDCVVSRSDVSMGMRMMRLQRKWLWWSVTVPPLQGRGPSRPYISGDRGEIASFSTPAWFAITKTSHVVDSVGALNHATNPSYPDTEPRMSRIKTRTGPSVSGSTVAKTHFSNQNKQMNPLFQKLDRP